MRKTFFLITTLLVLSGSFAYNTTIHLFYSSGCPHCAQERDYLESLDIPELTVVERENYYNESN
jgi:hypothetical protein